MPQQAEAAFPVLPAHKVHKGLLGMMEHPAHKDQREMMEQLAHKVRKERRV
jgi:hypothetical protein